MTGRRSGVIFVAAAALGWTVTLSAPVKAFWTVVRAPASTCSPFLHGVNASASGSYKGRIQSDQVGVDLQVYCPVPNYPTVGLDPSNLTVADRVAVFVANNAFSAFAQLCTEDNSSSTAGGSCDAGITVYGNGNPAQSIDFVMTSSTNWQVNWNSLPYIYVYMAGQSNGLSSTPVFSGYTLWHS
jgi:hypothetical protein